MEIVKVARPGAMPPFHADRHDACPGMPALSARQRDRSKNAVAKGDDRDKTQRRARSIR